ncbi:hypothetical protein LOS78_01725 [Paracoccus sp. MA]|uniref:hypothetical protein n=1 Tax=Paracoccus sp. MA TaxID=2895796 RepID=UPI001E2F0FC2|nr:hypothetical protein [Paracoccus sp. MA]UFM64218.1 hypothetical protein LOS78_01725 [Paracoccus sp. MA]
MNMQTTTVAPARHQLFNPKTRTLQFRAWQIAQREGGNVTREQIAAELGIEMSRMIRLLRDEKWASALRTSRLDLNDRPRHEVGFVREAEDFARQLGAVLAGQYE